VPKREKKEFPPPPNTQPPPKPHPPHNNPPTKTHPQPKPPPKLKFARKTCSLIPEGKSSVGQSLAWLPRFCLTRRGNPLCLGRLERGIEEGLSQSKKTPKETEKRATKPWQTRRHGPSGGVSKPRKEDSVCRLRRERGTQRSSKDSCRKGVRYDCLVLVAMYPRDLDRGNTSPTG